MTTETKALTPFAVKRVHESARTFEGLASTWDLDLGNDVIHKGAFAETLRLWKKTRRTIPLIDQHNYYSIRSVLGKLTEAKETASGLLTRFQVVTGDDGDALLARIKDGMVDGLSIGYEAINPKIEKGVRHLYEIKLREVSVVIWGMNPNALIESASVKSLERVLVHATDEQKHELRLLLDGRPAAAASDERPAAPDPQRPTREQQLRDLKRWSLTPRVR